MCRHSTILKQRPRHLSVLTPYVSTLTIKSCVSASIDLLQTASGADIGDHRQLTDGPFMEETSPPAKG